MSSEDEMVACFLSGELSSRRFGQILRSHLAAAGQTEQLLTHPDLSDITGADKVSTMSSSRVREAAKSPSRAGREA